jgi:DNA-binding NarL/FixJ family response regulator
LAHAADEAIEASQAQPPDVILLDVHLPGAGSPAALVARLRTLLPRASILLFSALADDELTSLSQRVGADGAIPKQAAFEIGARLEALAVAGKATP